MNLKIARLLHEDSEFVTLEVAKNDTAVFHLQQDAEGNVVGGDKFYTLMFIISDEEGTRAWDPFGGSR